MGPDYSVALIILVIAVGCLLLWSNHRFDRRKERQYAVLEENAQRFSRSLRIPVEEARRMLVEASSARPSEVAPRLFLGGVLASREPRLLRSLGISHVVNATASLPMVERSGGASFRTIRVPVDDALDADIAAHFDRSSDFIANALGDANCSCLVHCQQGVSRSATLVIAYLMRENGWPCARAIETVKRSRFIMPNLAFMTQLHRYEEHLTTARS